MRLFEARATYDDRVYAEAQALIDDGLDVELVLELFSADADWLAAKLDTSVAVIGAMRREEPSWYFEGSLKRRFIEAGMAKASGLVPMAEVAAPTNHGARLRTGFAAAGVVAGAFAAWVVAFGFLTADNADNGDWNYVFRAGRERIDYRFSDGNGRVDVRLHSTELSVQRIFSVIPRSEVTTDDIDQLTRELDALAQLAQKGPLDKPQQDRLREIGDQAVAALNEVKEKQPELESAVQAATAKVEAAVAAGTGAVRPIPAPETPSPSSSASAASSASPSTSPSATGTPAQTETPTTSPSPTTEPSSSPAASPPR